MNNRPIPLIFLYFILLIIRGGSDVDFLIIADADIDMDIYFQYLQMRMRILKILQISAAAYTRSTFTNNGSVVVMVQNVNVCYSQN